MEPFRTHHHGTVRSVARGFTLVELLVVLAIIITVTSVVFTGQSQFNRTLTLASTAYDIALSLRNAETYGMSGRASGTATNIGYGIEFQSSTPSAFSLFADTTPGPSLSGCHPAPRGDVTAPDALSGNCIYDLNQDKKVGSYGLGNGMYISDFCAYTANGVASCAVAHGGGSSRLDVIFSRPNPTPFITLNGLSTIYASACITVSSPQGSTRSVTVNTSGEIVAGSTLCP